MNEWDEWKKRETERIMARTPKKQEKLPAEKRPITADELHKLRRLQGIRAAWWCGDSRFIEQFKDADTSTHITERQAWMIGYLWYKYRKQLGHNGPKPEGIF